MPMWPLPRIMETDLHPPSGGVERIQQTPLKRVTMWPLPRIMETDLHPPSGGVERIQQTPLKRVPMKTSSR